MGSWLTSPKKEERYSIFILKVRQSQKQIVVSSILPKNDRWDNFIHWKLSQRLFFGRIEDTIHCFWDLLTFTGNMGEGEVENSNWSGDVIYGRSQSVCETKFSIRWGHLSSSAQVAGIGHDLHALNRKLNTAWGILERSKSKAFKMISR